MLQGEFERAWRISDAVLRRRRGRSAAHLPRHLRWVWDGTPLAGRRVLVRCNHGLGDTLQFARFLPDIARIARGVILEAPPALIPLLAELPGVDALIPLDGAVPPFEVEIEIMELAHALRVTPDQVSAAVPYLRMPGAARPASRAREALSVGIVWAAGDWRPERSLPPSLLQPLATSPGVVLVSLQQGDALGAIERLPFHVERPLGSAARLEDTASLIAQLDLVLTVDTMVAHLAGALGARVWTLLDWGADWRWMLERSDSPWYPTMRLFRQPQPSAWASVIDEVAAALGARPSA
jgi:hypothetical protein